MGAISRERRRNDLIRAVDHYERQQSLNGIEQKQRSTKQPKQLPIPPSLISEHTWLWNDGVQRKIQEKKSLSFLCIKRWPISKLLRMRTKSIVITWVAHYKNLYDKLSPFNCQISLCRLAKTTHSHTYINISDVVMIRMVHCLQAVDPQRLEYIKKVWTQLAYITLLTLEHFHLSAP